MKASFEILGRLPGMNELIGAINRHRFAGATMKKQKTFECGQWILAGKVPKFTEPVAIRFEWIEPDRRRDIDNIAGGGSKFILDALVATERIPNDTREWVKSIEHVFPEPDPKRPRIVVTIETVAAAENAQAELLKAARNVLARHDTGIGMTDAVMNSLEAAVVKVEQKTQQASNSAARRAT